MVVLAKYIKVLEKYIDCFKAQMPSTEPGIGGHVKAPEQARLWQKRVQPTIAPCLAVGSAHTYRLIRKLGRAIRKLKNRSVCMQSAFLLFCCCDEKSMHTNLSPS